jgi:hypothetical protein
MILNKEQLLWLYRSIGQGPIDLASIIIFANEFGAARGRGNTESSINQFINEFKTRKLLKIDEGFTVLDIDSPPVSSIFLQYVSRLSLALKFKDERFFDELSEEGKAFLNNYIMNSLYRENTGVINYRPLLQPTEDKWPYENISESSYKRLFDFTLKNKKENALKNFRVKILKAAFDMTKKECVIIGSGDQTNKKYFFQYIYPTIQFKEINLSENYNVYYSDNLGKHIILSKYFDNRTLGLFNLKLLYQFIEKIPKEKPLKSISSQMLF